MHEEHLLELDDDEKSLSLTRNEALYLSDSITLMIEKEAPHGEGHTMIGTMRNVVPSAPLPVPIEIIEKVGMAVLYTTDTDNLGKEYSAMFAYNELYLLREIAQSYVKVGNEQVGYNLKRKIYNALLSEQYEGEKLANQLLKDINAEDSLKNAVNLYRSGQDPQST